jgi:phage terminase small subunit
MSRDPNTPSSRPTRRKELRLRTILHTFAMELVANNMSIKKAAEKCGLEYSTALGYKDRDDVQAMCTEMIEQKIEAESVTADLILSELVRVAQANVGDFIDDDGDVIVSAIKSRGGSAVSEYVTSQVERDGRISTHRRLKLNDKLRALELLGRYKAMFTDKVQVEGLDNLAEEMKLARTRVEDGK